MVCQPGTAFLATWAGFFIPRVLAADSTPARVSPFAMGGAKSMESRAPDFSSKNAFPWKILKGVILLLRSALFPLGPMKCGVFATVPLYQA